MEKIEITLRRNRRVNAEGDPIDYEKMYDKEIDLVEKLWQTMGLLNVGDPYTSKLTAIRCEGKRLMEHKQREGWTGWPNSAEEYVERYKTILDKRFNK